MVDIRDIEQFESSLGMAEFAGIEFPSVARLHFGQASYIVGIVRKQSHRLSAVLENRLQESIAKFTIAESVSINERIKGNNA